MMGLSQARRCLCPCPAPLPQESTWSDFSVGTWTIDAKLTPNKYMKIQRQQLPFPTGTCIAYSKSCDSNDSGMFCTSPTSATRIDSNIIQYNNASSNNNGDLSRNCDIITDALDQLTLRESRFNPGYSIQSDVSLESSVISPRYARWAGIATELESWEKRLSVGWSGGQIPRGQLNSFIEFLKRLRQVVRRKSEEGLDLCAFCRNNGEPFEVYISHKVRNASGQVTCPILRLLSCPLCKATGDQAHTIKYCPYRKKFKSSDSP